ncbi:GAF domain-containing protein [Bacillus aerolatus]|uniref:GAF domain-containing protein n=1 Tax=Bacillus aerolatus TaxID=2653354 RepID=A0A6I1FMH7_9BACI|nr:sigma-54-dependent Fis family transcriptional regulator [Bacillus aerolatus]KAB7708239.1 GAF domain-containing protein [Bacillus aerolatus]
MIRSHYQLVEKDVPEIVIESWERSRKSNVSRDLSEAPLVLSEKELQLIKSRGELYQSFAAVYSRMENEIDGKYAFGLADEKGRMIGVRMEGKLYDQLGGVNFFPGGHWHENITGTNAIGTAIATQKAVTIHTEEHYCEAWNAFSCAGVPIRHPLKKQLLGVLDLSCKDEDFHKHSLPLTKAIAESIQADILVRTHEKNNILRERFSQHKENVRNDWLLLIDDQGNIIDQNHYSKPFQYVWKSSFNWYEYINGLQHKAFNKKDQHPLSFLHGHPRGKITPVPNNNTIIGLIVQLPQNYSSENLSTTFKEEYIRHGVVGRGEPFQFFLEKIEKVAPSNVSVMLTGESGTGKEVFSRMIHRLSDRCEQSFITFNCSSLNHDLAASELFGYAPGSFTGGLKEGKKGLFEAADGGVLFLDEIGEVPLSVQPLLLRVLQEQEVMRIGEYTPRKINVRVIAATNRDLKKMMQEGTFREDLYYRLSVISLNIPPLRERKEDIPLLSNYFLEQSGHNRNIILTPETERILRQYDWPGNVRELKNVIQYAQLFAGDGFIEPHHLPDVFHELPYAKVSEERLENNKENKKENKKDERDYILHMLKRTNFNLTKAAQLLGFSRGTLYNRLKKYNISYRY